MAHYMMQKMSAIKARLLGLWQHAVQPGPAFSPADNAAEPVIGTQRGRTVIHLSGRDVPQRSEPRIWTNHRGELEVHGFLDQFPQHPLLNKQCRHRQKPMPVTDVKEQKS